MTPVSYAVVVGCDQDVTSRDFLSFISSFVLKAVVCDLSVQGVCQRQKPHTIRRILELIRTVGNFGKLLNLLDT